MNGAPPRRIVIDPNVFISATITPAGAPGAILSLIDDGTLVPPRATRDRKDDYLVALALRAAAEVIATGDDDLHAAENLAVEVLTPREVLTRLKL